MGGCGVKERTGEGSRGTQSVLVKQPRAGMGRMGVEERERWDGGALRQELWPFLHGVAKDYITCCPARHLSRFLFMTLLEN